MIQANLAMAYTNLSWRRASGKQLQICFNTSRMYGSNFQFRKSQKLIDIQRGETDFFSGEPLRALSTLVFSDNVDLQRSASLTFAEITERGTSTRGMQRDGFYEKGLD